MLKNRYGSDLVIKGKLYGRLIQLQSEDTKAYVDAKKTLNNLMLPSVKNCNSDPILCQFVLGDNFKTIVAQNGSTVISVKKYWATVYVYGSKEGQTAAIGLLEQPLKSELHIQRFDIKLKGPGRPAGLMKQIVSKFG